MTTLLESISSQVLVVLMLISFSLVGLLILFVVQKVLMVNVAFDNKLPLASISPILGFFSILLAFLTISVWQSHGNIKNIVGRKSNAIYSIYRNLDAYPPGFKDVAKERLKVYVQEVVGREWHMMQSGEPDYAALQKLKLFHDTVINFVPANNGELVAHQQLLLHFSLYRELRRDRVNSAHSLVGNLMWLILGLSLVITTIFLSCLAVKKFSSHVIFICFFSANISLIFSMLLLVNNPFLGPEGIGPGPFQQLLTTYFPLP